MSHNTDSYRNALVGRPEPVIVVVGVPVESSPAAKAIKTVSICFVASQCATSFSTQGEPLLGMVINRGAHPAAARPARRASANWATASL
jgi:hypothetical protein